jgi:hypothetical protein
MPYNVHEHPRVRQRRVNPTQPQSELQRLAAAGRRAVFSGATASLSSAVALSICSRIDEGSYAGGLNGPSQWLWGRAEAYAREASARHTVVGYIVHHLTSMFWATLYERLFDEVGARKTAYVVDYHLTPRRLRPGFKKHVRTPSMFIIYGAFALGLAAASIIRDSNALCRRQ